MICNTYIIYRANSWLWQNMCTNSSQKAMNQTFWFCLVNGILTQVNVYTFWKTLVSLFYSEIICRISNLLQLLVQTDKLKTNVVVETCPPHHTHTVNVKIFFIRQVNEPEIYNRCVVCLWMNWLVIHSCFSRAIFFYLLRT